MKLDMKNLTHSITKPCTPLAVLGVLLLTFTPRFSTCFAQGSLTPPGAPGATFKTLSQVEPRFPISDFQTNLTIPGSYYLTTNLVSGTNSNDAINLTIPGSYY